MEKWVAIEKFARALATGIIAYFLPQIVQATKDGPLTLLFGTIAIFCIWVF